VLHAAVNPGFYECPELVIEPANPTLDSRLLGIPPVVLQVRPIAKVGVSHVSETEDALNCLNEIKTHTMAKPVPTIEKRSYDMKTEIQKGRRPLQYRDSYPSNPFLTRIFELSREYRKFVLVA